MWEGGREVPSFQLEHLDEGRLTHWAKSRLAGGVIVAGRLWDRMCVRHPGH